MLIVLQVTCISSRNAIDNYKLLQFIFDFISMWQVKFYQCLVLNWEQQNNVSIVNQNAIQGYKQQNPKSFQLNNLPHLFNIPIFPKSVFVKLGCVLSITYPILRSQPHASIRRNHYQISQPIHPVRRVALTCTCPSRHFNTQDDRSLAGDKQKVEPSLTTKPQLLLCLPACHLK